ncbi:MAG: TIGR00725 family protein [Chitinispirillaceae bacterium]|nr:TIGR00725 family protein [Chitinispirillaceae bacterium]
MATRPVVGVIGSGGTIDEKQYHQAYEVGTYLAQRNAVLVCGGLGGIMEAASRGAAENGGTIIGILPSTARDDANAFVTVSIPTGMGVARNALVAHTADVLIAFPGAFGTLSEMAIALDLQKSVVCMPRAWDLRKAGTFADVRLLEAFDAKQAVGMALGEIGKRRMSDTYL